MITQFIKELARRSWSKSEITRNYLILLILVGVIDSIRYEYFLEDGSSSYLDYKSQFVCILYFLIDRDIILLTCQADSSGMNPSNEAD